MIFIPEIFIVRNLKAMLLELKEGIGSDVNKNLITDMFKGLSTMEDFDMMGEARKFFSKDNCLDIKVGLDISTKTLPALHIYLPEENINAIPIGADPENWDEDENDNSFNEVNTVRFTTNYNIAIIGLNGDQIVFIYNVLKWMVFRYIHIFELDGFQNLKVRGGDLKMEQNITPQTIYTRILSLVFEYEMQSINKIEKLGGRSLDVDRLKLKIEPQ